MVQNFKDANVDLSDFKPTQNVEHGKENQIDPVLVSGDLGPDKFFSKAFERQTKIDEAPPSFGHGNKGLNMGNLTSFELVDEIGHNIDRVRQNTEDSHIIGDSFKPNHDVFKGRDLNKEPSHEEAFKGQTLQETLDEKPTA